jgi:von Willebrand factor type A domain
MLKTMRVKNNCIGLSTTIASWILKLSLPCLAILAGDLRVLAASGTVEIVGTPVVSNDQVTIRVKVKAEDGKPVLDLRNDNFQLHVDGQPVKFRPKDWKSSQEATPPPAWIVFLLDYSGSMNSTDAKGKTKLAGSIESIRAFIKSTAKRGGDTRVAIVPFGEDDKDTCNKPVTSKEIDRFFVAGDFKLENQIQNLAADKPCAATNIYEPVSSVVKFFTNPKDSRFVLDDNNSIKPRMSIVLLSDGYHNKPNEDADFKQLLALLDDNKESLVIHTLGYGLTPEQLGQKYGLNRAAIRKDIGTGPGKIPEGEFVDQDRLDKIAAATGGISAFSPDSKAVTEKLDLFLNAEPNPERGSKHQVTVKVLRDKIPTVTSAFKDYTINVFGRSVPLQTRIIMMVGLMLLLSLGGILPFWLWGKQLRQEALDN